VDVFRSNLDEISGRINAQVAVVQNFQPPAPAKKAAPPTTRTEPPETEETPQPETPEEEPTPETQPGL